VGGRVGERREGLERVKERKGGKPLFLPFLWSILLFTKPASLVILNLELRWRACLYVSKLCEVFVSVRRASCCWMAFEHLTFYSALLDDTEQYDYLGGM